MDELSTGRRAGVRASVLAVSVAIGAGCTNRESGYEAGSGGSAGASAGATSGRAGGTGGGSSGGAGQTGGVAPAGGVTQTGGTAQTGGSAQTGGAAPTGGAGGVAQSGGAGGARAGWTEEWNSGSPTRFYQRGTTPNSVTSNIADSAALDGRALRLVLGANPQPTPAGGAEVGTNARLQFGTFSTRLRTADCSGQPNAGVVTGFFTFFNDGSDTTSDGLPDNSEIDFEWLCAEPQTLYLTMWTDYRDSDTAQKRVSRGINLATGTILYTCYYTAFGNCTEALSGAEAAPSTVAPLAGYDSSAGYYEYGFDWATDSVVWWIRNPQDSQKIALWNYRGPKARITQISAACLTNVWHTADWPPDSQPNATAAPTQAVSVWVDWTRYEAP